MSTQPMKTFVFQPDSHGPLTFIVCAPDEATARQCVLREIDRLKHQVERDDGGFDYVGTGTEQHWVGGDYTMTVLEPLQVATNAND